MEWRTVSPLAAMTVQWTAAKMAIEMALPAAVATVAKLVDEMVDVLENSRAELMEQ